MNAEARSVLERPFAADQLRSRRATSGKSLTYVETYAYIERLNEAYDGRWDFVVLEHQVLDTEVVVLGRLFADGVTKTAFGGSNRTVSRDSGEAISLADDLKAAASDALKKCCSLLGLGLHLYGAPEARTDAAVTPTIEQVPPPQTVSDNALTERQLRAIHGIAGRIGMDPIRLDAWVDDVWSVCVESLDRRQASEVITALNQMMSGGNGKAVGGVQ